MTNEAPESLFERLTSALDEAGDAVFDPTDIDEFVELEDGESMTWLAQTYRHTEMINLFCLSQGGRDCTPSAPVRQNEGFHERRISGSS
jgi:hypothetical protein